MVNYDVAMPAWCRDIDGGVELRVKVVPGASRERIAGLLGGELKIQVAAAPERGKANAAVERLIAGALGVAASAVRVTAGHTQPRKTIYIAGLSAAEVAAKLNLEPGK
jgi:uncharacterized protein